MSEALCRFDFSGNTVLVTGGTSGIGLGIAKAFHAAGAEVYITGTRKAASDYDENLEGFHFLQLQLEDKSSIDQLCNHLQKLDILINNAGASFPDGKNEWEPDIFERALHINLSSAYRISSNCKNLLTQSSCPGGASIINLASLTSFFAVEAVPGYGAAKAGLSQLTKTLGLSWAKDGIRTNAIAAGLIQTRMTAGFADNPDFCKPILARTPLKRTGTPEDIADVALFLCSDSARFIVGQTILVDGGYSVVG